MRPWLPQNNMFFSSENIAYITKIKIGNYSKIPEEERVFKQAL